MWVQGIWTQVLVLVQWALWLNLKYLSSFGMFLYCVLSPQNWLQVQPQVKSTAYRRADEMWEWKDQRLQNREVLPATLYKVPFTFSVIEKLLAVDRLLTSH